MVNQMAICGVCGSPLRKRGDEFICGVCERFFGITGEIRECMGIGGVQCSNKFAYLPAIDAIITGLVLSREMAQIWEEMCPTCRKNSRFFGSLIGGAEWSDKETTKEIIRALIKSRSMIPSQLEMREIPRDFIEYCVR